MSNSKRYPCRCLGRVKRKTPTKHDGEWRTCDARRSLRRNPQQYIHQPKCPKCGERNWAIDWHRVEKEMGPLPMCNCTGGLHFPHRKGSKYCEWHPRFEEDCAERDQLANDSSKGTGNRIDPAYAGFTRMIDNMEAI